MDNASCESFVNLLEKVTLKIQRIKMWYPPHIIKGYEENKTKFIQTKQINQ